MWLFLGLWLGLQWVSQLPGFSPVFFKWLYFRMALRFHNFSHGSHSCHKALLSVYGRQTVVVGGGGMNKDALFGILLITPVLLLLTFIQLSMSHVPQSVVLSFIWFAIDVCGRQTFPAMQSSLHLHFDTQGRRVSPTFCNSLGSLSFMASLTMQHLWGKVDWGGSISMVFSRSSDLWSVLHCAFPLNRGLIVQ